MNRYKITLVWADGREGAYAREGYSMGDVLAGIFGLTADTIRGASQATRITIELIEETS